MTEPSGYALEALWEDGEFVLSRGVARGRAGPAPGDGPRVGPARAGEPRAAGAAGSARSTRCSRPSTKPCPGAQ